MELPLPLKQLKDFDDRRPSLPGEHWIALGAGALLLLWAARRRSWATAGAGLGMLARAASGRDGLPRVIKPATAEGPHDDAGNPVGEPAATPSARVVPLHVGQR